MNLHFMHLPKLVRELKFATVRTDNGPKYIKWSIDIPHFKIRKHYLLKNLRYNVYNIYDVFNMIVIISAFSRVSIQ